MKHRQLKSVLGSSFCIVEVCLLLHVSNLHIGRIFHDPWQKDAKGPRQRHTHKSTFTFRNGAAFRICLKIDVASCCHRNAIDQDTQLKQLRSRKRGWLQSAQVPAATWLNLIHKHQQLSALSAAIRPNETDLGHGHGSRGSHCGFTWV